MPKLTQCLIVKNEVRNLPRALAWAKGLADEQIVVDTGSTDGTEASAKKLGAKVVHFDWVNDFSAARNFALTQCTGDWIFFLDADEYFAEEDIPLLYPLLEKADRQYAFIKDKKYQYNVIETPWVNVANGNVTRQTRILRNVPYLRYAGALHEKLCAAADNRLVAYSVKDRPAIYHTGYVWSEDNRQEAKAARNFELARHALQKQPGCALLRLYAAEALMFEGKYASALEYFCRAMKNGDGSIAPGRAREGYRQWLSIFLHIDETQTSDLPRQALRVYSEAAAMFPDEPEYDLLMCRFYFRSKDVINAMRALNTAMSKDKDHTLAAKLKAADGEAFQKLCDACKNFENKPR